MRSHPSVFVGAVVFLLLTLCAVFAPLLAPHDPNQVNLSLYAKPPFWMRGAVSGYILGTDGLGRDLLSRLLYGSRIAVIVAGSTVLIGGTIGVTLGLLAGYAGGRSDALIGAVANVQCAFPVVLLAVAIVGIVGPSLLAVILILGTTSWVQYVRVVRIEARRLRDRDFVQAAIATGASTPRILIRHVLPNIASSVSVIATFESARAVIIESGLSFLGLGVPPALSSWGSMLGEGREYIDTAWWLALFPGLAITLAVFGVNAFGDWCRDALDPRSVGH